MLAAYKTDEKILEKIKKSHNDTSMEISNRHSGMLFIVSSPSGAGKTTLCRRLMRQYPELSFSISYTTRPKRPQETDGVDYHFVSDSVFDEMIGADAFAEWAHVHGQRYGTSKELVRSALQKGCSVLFDIDHQGGESLFRQFPKEAHLIYILPPSIEVLSQRLRARGTESQENIAQRLAKAKQEISHYTAYHYLVLNGDFDRAYEEVTAIYEVEKARAEGHAESAAQLAIVEECLVEKRAHFADQLLVDARIEP